MATDYEKWWARRKLNQKLGDGPVEERFVKQMNALGAAIDAIFNGEVKGDKRETGFVLLVFPFGDNEGRCNFISNGANREDIVVLFKEMIARFEGQPETQGHA